MSVMCFTNRSPLGGLSVLLFLTFVPGIADAQDLPLSARVEEGVVHLQAEGVYWEFTVERSVDPSGPFESIGFRYIGCTESCEWFDSLVEPGSTYVYRFEALSQDGRTVRLGPTVVRVPGIAGSLLQSRPSPNPAEGEVTLRFWLSPERTSGYGARIALAIYDARGSLVRELDGGIVEPGEREILWDARDTNGADLPAGLYFYRLRADAIVESGRILLVGR